MAKKKAKKKKVKRKSPKKKCTIHKRFSLLEKIQRITERVPQIEPTGEVIDEQTSEVLFRFTEAQNVFRTYRDECAAEGIRWRPYCAVGIQPVVTPFARGIAALIPFCIEDIETKEIIIGWGFGVGANADWSGNTAHTRALKQFLLTTFQATWEDPEQLSHREQRKLLKEQVRAELEANGTIGVIESMREYFAQKGGPNGTESTGRKHTKSRARTGDKKNRGGSKRDNR